MPASPKHSTMKPRTRTRRISACGFYPPYKVITPSKLNPTAFRTPPQASRPKRPLALLAAHLGTTPRARNANSSADVRHKHAPQAHMLRTRSMPAPLHPNSKSHPAHARRPRAPNSKFSPKIAASAVARVRRRAKPLPASGYNPKLCSTVSVSAPSRGGSAKMLGGVFENVTGCRIAR